MKKETLQRIGKITLIGAALALHTYNIIKSEKCIQQLAEMLGEEVGDIIMKK